MTEHPRYSTVSQLRGNLKDYSPRDIDGDYPDAAVAVAVTDGPNPSLLLTQRTQRMRLHSGQVAFPGGRHDAADADLLTTATREMEEEVGIDHRRFRELGRLNQRISRTGIRVTPWVGLIPPDEHLTLSPREVDVAFYVPLDYFCNPRHLEVQNVTTGGRRHSLKAWHYKSRGREFNIWGLTAAIIVDLANSCLDAGLPVDEPLL